jgi:hypothetical protein
MASFFIVCFSLSDVAGDGDEIAALFDRERFTYFCVIGRKHEGSESLDARKKVKKVSFCAKLGLAARAESGQRPAD